jgi:hypothetical protein
MFRLVLLLAVVSLAGCGARTIITDPNMYSVTGPTTALRSGERVALVNGYAAQTMTEIGEHGGNQFMVDLRQVTDTAIAMAAKHHKVTREQLSVRERMSSILRSLQGHGFLEFTQLFSPLWGIADLVVTFLAILELARESLIDITQQASFSAIYVKAHDGSFG